MMVSLYRYIGYTLMLLLPAVNGVLADTVRQELSAATLLTASQLHRPVPMSAFAPPDNAMAPKHTFQGRLVFTDKQQHSTASIVRDDYRFSKRRALKTDRLPVFDIELVQSGHHLIPAKRGAVVSEHPHWRYRVAPGRVWQEASDKGYSRAAIPFSLQEKNANCTHNGVISFLFKTDGSISSVAYQIASETCMYFKFDLWGLAEARFIAAAVDGSGRLVSGYKKEISSRLPVKSIAQLAIDYPAIDTRLLGGRERIDPADMTLFGFVIDGVNYVGGCQTRYGTHPYCEVMDLPSYSLAKTLFAGLGLMYLERRYPGARHQKIADYVPECKASGHWQDVSFENALDMVTGNYQSASNGQDEGSQALHDHFFTATTHAEKIDYACNAMPRKAEPGSRWVYHTSDTYILGSAINQFIKQNNSDSSDSFRDIFVKLWQPLGLSPITAFTLRSDDHIAQPFTGYGLTAYHDDIARMASAINDTTSYLNTVLDTSMLDAALQRSAADRGFVAADTGFHYNNGFWAYNVQASLGCEHALWLPFMSGFGGINVVMMPNDTVYYSFSDGGTFSWLDAGKASNSIRPYCH